MTKEQALEIVKLQRRLINTKNSFGKELADALDIVIETVVVEREKIDKAIEEIKVQSYAEHIDGADCDDVLVVELRDALEILDKLVEGEEK